MFTDQKLASYLNQFYIATSFALEDIHACLSTMMAPSKQEQDVEEQAFLPPSQPPEDIVWPRREGRSSRAMRYLRIAVEIAMAVIIVVLLVDPVQEQIEGKRSPVPKCMFHPRSVGM